METGVFTYKRVKRTSNVPSTWGYVTSRRYAFDVFRQRNGNLKVSTDAHLDPNANPHHGTNPDPD